MGQPHTHSTWIVKQGQEDEFVRRWKEFAQWSSAQGLRGSARLFRDVETPNRFVSIGPWESLEAVQRWRSMPGFHDRVMRLQEILDSFEPRTLELVAEH